VEDPSHTDSGSVEKIAAPTLQLHVTNACAVWCLQVPAGFAADRFGGKWLFGGSVLLSSVVALLTPAAARIHIGLLTSLRVLSGLGDGVMVPAMFALIARWSAPQYRSIVVSLVFSGMDAGIFTGFLLSGVLCDYGFAGGWPSVFYVFGMVGCLCSGCWFFLSYNSPQTHPRISTAELDYWKKVIGAGDLESHPPTPWRDIFTSVPVWALAVTFFAVVWLYILFASCLPLFMHDVLGVNMTRNGELSTVPFIGSLLALTVTGVLVDWLRSPGRLSTTFVRKLVCVVGFTVSGIAIVSAGYVGCNRTLVTMAISVAVAIASLNYLTAAANPLDLAPLHAGKIMGLTYAFGNLGAIGGPLAVGALTSEQSTRSEWQRVFFLTAAINAVSGTAFVVFGSGERQSWAD